jgi:site-specific recombinase XerD
VKSSSLVTYDRAWGLYRESLTTVGQTVESAKREHVTAFLLQTGWARSTMGTALAYLNAAYNFAVDELEVLERNPCRRVRLPKAPVRVPRTIPNRILRHIWNDTRDHDDRLLFSRGGRGQGGACMDRSSHPGGNIGLHPCKWRRAHR